MLAFESGSNPVAVSATPGVRAILVAASSQYDANGLLPLRKLVGSTNRKRMTTITELQHKPYVWRAFNI